MCLMPKKLNMFMVPNSNIKKLLEKMLLIYFHLIPCPSTITLHDFVLSLLLRLSWLFLSRCIPYFIKVYLSNLIYYFWFTQIIQCSEDDGKIGTFMTIDKQIQKLKKENSTQDAANLRYLTNFYLFDYIVSISYGMLMK